MRVDDLETYLTRAEQLGGTRVMPPMELPGDFGTIAIIADPDEPCRPVGQMVR